jgi:pyruvate/2-oxoglutarate dehydrogenase complex dihydrolipoamide dehydrogenase (E3) component
MEAAIVASSRGHDVVLHEKQKDLGGNLRIAVMPSFKADMRRYLNWLTGKTMRSVDVRLSSESTPASVKAQNADVVIVAVGSEARIPSIPGIEKHHVALAGDVEAGKAETGRAVIVAGAGLVGCEAALELSQNGKKVALIDMLKESEIASDVNPTPRFWLLESLRRSGVVVQTETRLEEITDRGVIISREGIRSEISADTVVLALGYEAQCETVDAFRESAREVYIVGDCSSPRNLMAAIHDAFNVAMEI